MINDTWDDDSLVSSAPMTPLQNAKRLVELRERIAELSKQEEEIEQLFASMFPDEPGEYEHNDVGFSVTIKKRSVFSWDSDALDAMFASTPLPPHVKKRLSVPKAEYERLSPAEQDEIKGALTIKVSKPKVEVKFDDV